MADKKISQLTAATTPLAGTEVLPIVQGGSTVKVSVADLTSGRSVTTGDASLNGAVTINDSGADKDFRVEGDTNTHLLFTDASADRVGINVAGPAYKLDLLSAGTSVARFQGPEYGQTVFTDGTRSAFVSVFDNVARFSTAGATPFSLGTNDVNRLTLDTSGNAKVENGNLVVGTAAKGIDFSANTGAPGETGALLNWYEEGTWTPEYAPETNAFDAITYGFNTGRYVRIGSMVWVTWSMRTSALTVGSASGTVYIKNLPFTSRNANPGSGATFTTGVDFAVNNALVGVVFANDNKITLYRGANNVTVVVSDLGTGGADNFTAGTICYQA
jgi:hypothetical protein